MAVVFFVADCAFFFFSQMPEEARGRRVFAYSPLLRLRRSSTRICKGTYALRSSLHVLTHNRLGVVPPKGSAPRLPSRSPGDMKLNTWGFFTRDIVEG